MGRFGLCSRKVVLESKLFGWGKAFLPLADWNTLLERRQCRCEELQRKGAFCVAAVLQAPSSGQQDQQLLGESEHRLPEISASLYHDRLH